MNTQSKIKELIEKYKNLGVLRTFSNPSDVVKDLESLLECEHEHISLKRKGWGLCFVCDNCNEVLDEL